MSDERRPSVSRRQFLVGVALVAAGIFVAVTRDGVSEWLVGTLVGLGLFTIGVPLPDRFPWDTRGDKEED